MDDIGSLTARTGLTSEERTAIDELRRTLTADFPLVHLRLIGSKARGDSAPGSDLDLLIVLKDCDWQMEKRIYDLCFDISVAHDVLLSPVIYTQSEYASRRNRVTPFYRITEAEGIPL
jgi:predicted nucleotidyltransferase